MAKKNSRHNRVVHTPAKIKYDFVNHRTFWEKDSFYEKWFGKSQTANASAQYFKKKLCSLPIDEKFKVVGYGSLMNGADADRTIKESEGFPVYAPGWERIFNMGRIRTGSFLNVRRNDNAVKDMAAIMYEVNWEQMPALLMREGLYDLEWTTVRDEWGTEHEALIVVGSLGNQDDFIQPQLNYLHLCMTGIQDQFGFEGVDNFLDTTFCYSPNHQSQVSVREWLTTMNTLTYILSHDYSPR